MRALTRRDGAAMLACAVVLLSAGEAWACSDRGSVWDWDRCWLSVPRWLLLAAACAGWWFVCFHRLFPRLLDPSRQNAPWPGVAFRRCLALFWQLSVLTFVALFGWLSDELSEGTARIFPAPLAWLNRHWKWLLAVLIGVAGALVIWAPRRARDQMTR
jgi:hypothetical protein